MMKDINNQIYAKYKYILCFVCTRTNKSAKPVGTAKVDMLWLQEMAIIVDPVLRLA